MVCGEFSVPLRLANNRCGYKYVLLKKNKPIFEEVVEYQSRWGGFVNRCLVINGEYAVGNSKLPGNSQFQLNMTLCSRT